jgi:hypothetical protein
VTGGAAIVLWWRPEGGSLDLPSGREVHVGGSLRIQTLADRIKGPIDTLRLKLQLHAQDAAPDGAASAAEIAALVDHQLRHWRRRGIDRRALLEGCRTLNEKSISVFVFEIRAGTVTAWRKPGFSFPPELAMLRAMQARSFANRAALYRVLLQAVLARSGIDDDMTLAIDVNDIPARMRGGPLFAFQTADATRNILLPDVDFFHWNWYAGQHDDRAYEDKTITACFAGASTGGPVSGPPSPDARCRGCVRRLTSWAARPSISESPRRCPAKPRRRGRCCSASRTSSRR